MFSLYNIKILFICFYLENTSQSIKPVRTSTKIRFIEDSDLEETQNLMRIPTPHPKKMRAFANMLLERKKKNNVKFLISKMFLR